MLIDLQLNPATTPWNEYLDRARRAESDGFDGLWVYDHLSGAMLRGDTMLECFTLLGALCTATDRISLGSMVVNAAVRHPGVLAASAASIQTMSGGRLLLGLGAGAAPGSRWAAEFDMLGIDLGSTMEQRHERLRSTVATISAIWADPAAYPGYPRPAPRPPLFIGLNSVALARTAAGIADGINVMLGGPRHAEFIEAARAARPGYLPPLTVSVTTSYHADLLDPDHPTRRLVDSLGVDRLILAVFDAP